MDSLGPHSPTRGALVDALRATVLPFQMEGRSGTAFYLSRNHIATAAHVLGDGLQPGDDIEVVANDASVQLAIRALRPEHPRLGTVDIAILEAPPTDTWAYVSPELEPRDELFAFGHPAGAYAAGDSLSLVVDGPSVRQGNEAYVRLSGSKAIPGFSGSPLLNWRTGAVCGILSRANDAAVRAVPMHIVLELFPDLEQRKNGADTAVGWLDLLTNEQLSAGGSRYVTVRLGQYLEAIQSVANQHPYGASLPNPPRLSEVYLEQELSPDSVSTGLEDASSKPSTDQAAVVTARQLVRTKTKGSIIFGDPGAGKSSLLRDLAREMADGWVRGRDDVDAGVPVLIDASSLASSASLIQAVAMGVRKTCGALLMDTNLEDLFSRPPLAGVDWVLLVDGLDEIASASERRRVVEVASSIATSRNPIRCLITSRRLDSPEMALVDRAELVSLHIQPFTLRQLPDLAERWFLALDLPNPSGLRTRFYRSLIRSRLMPLARLPLIATMLCVVFAGDPDSPLPTSRIKLYERFVDALTGKRFMQFDHLSQLRTLTAAFGSEVQREVERLQVDVVPLLAVIAYRRCVGSEHDVGRDIVREAADEMSGRRPSIVPAERWADIVSAVIRQSGLIAWRGDRHDFIHLTIAEYLAALYESSARVDEPTVAEALNDSGTESFREFRILTAVNENASLADKIAAALLNGGVADALRLAGLSRAGMELSSERRLRAMRVLATRRADLHHMVSVEATAEAMAWIDLDSALEHFVRMVGQSPIDVNSGIISVIRAMLRAAEPDEFERLSDLSCEARLHCSMRDWFTGEFSFRMQGLEATQIAEIATDGRLSGWFRVRALHYLSPTESLSHRHALTRHYTHGTFSPTHRRFYGVKLLRMGVISAEAFIRTGMLDSATSASDAIHSALLAAGQSPSKSAEELFRLSVAHFSSEDQLAVAKVLRDLDEKLATQLFVLLRDGDYVSSSTRAAATIALALRSNDPGELLSRANTRDAEEQFIILSEMLNWQTGIALDGLAVILNDTAAGSWRVEALRLLLRHDPESWAGHCAHLATDARLGPADRLFCARRIEPSRQDDKVRAYELLLPDHPILNTVERFEVATEFLEFAGAEAIPRALAIANDPLVDPAQRFQLALGIADADSNTGADILASLADDETMDSGRRPGQAVFAHPDRLVPAQGPASYASYQLLCARQLQSLDLERGIAALERLKRLGDPELTTQAQSAIAFFRT